METFASNGWFAGNNKERQSLETFRVSIYHYLTSFEKAYQSLQKSYLPFEEREILPYQCRNAIRDLSLLKNQIAQVCVLMKDNRVIPIVILALRYQLLDKLHHIDETSDELIYLIDLYMGLYLCSSQDAYKEQIIKELFEKLLKLLADIPKQTKTFFVEAYHQEEKLA